MQTSCLFFLFLCPILAIERTYWVAADEVIWDYLPSNVDGATGMPFDTNSEMGLEASMWVVSGPNRIGKQYLKVLYREYTDETFQTLKPRGSEWEHLGYLGPVLRAEVGDILKVHFKNYARNPYSMHPHGVFYDKDNEGVASGMQIDSMAKSGNMVMPNESWIYTWPVPERAGPAARDASSIVWMYHSHVEEVRDTNSGLVGAIIVTRAGMADDAGKPQDVAREFVVVFSILDENWSWYLEDNIRTYLPGNTTEVMTDPEFMMSNKKHAVNGLLFSNLKGLSMLQNGTVRWHVIAIGDELDLHGVHWHGQTLVVDGHRVDTMELIPASMKTLDMVPDNVGQWFFHCHTNHHIMGGMIALFDVLPCQGPCPNELISGVGLNELLASFTLMAALLSS